LKNSKNIIVFGGSGFLASHICDCLTDCGYKVTLFDKKRSKYLKQNQKMLIADITDFSSVQKAIKQQNYVFHFAGVADIGEANLNPFKTIKYNILGTTNILEAIKNNKKVIRIVFASSVYARSKWGGFYSSTKRTCESLIENYREKFNINYTILRFGSIYGLRANYFNIIHNLIAQGLKSNKIERDGNGKEIRNYINAKDAAKICVKILNKKYANKYFNIVGKERVSVRKVINLIAKKTRTKKIIYRKNKADVYHYKVNPFTYKVKEAKFIKVKNGIKLEQGIQEIIDNYLKYKKFKY
jgi:UDP-glucose 4-epimerase